MIWILIKLIALTQIECLFINSWGKARVNDHLIESKLRGEDIKTLRERIVKSKESCLEMFLERGEPFTGRLFVIAVGLRGFEYKAILFGHMLCGYLIFYALTGITL